MPCIAWRASPMKTGRNCSADVRRDAARSGLRCVQVEAQVACLYTSSLATWTHAAVALTNTALMALKPQGRIYTVLDERGLYVEVFPTGGVVWRYRYRLNGKAEKLTLGKYPALTLKNARLKRD